VFERERPERRGRRRGKNDRRDAVLAARRLPAAEEGLSELRGGGELREPLRVLLLERRSADAAGTAALNQLHALAVTAPLAEPGLRELRGQPRRRTGNDRTRDRRSACRAGSAAGCRVRRRRAHGRAAACLQR